MRLRTAIREEGGFISYYDADGFISELERMLADDVNDMLDQNNYMCAFRLMNHIFETLGEVDMDDSAGGTAMLAEEIYDNWMRLLDPCQQTGKERDV